MQKIVILLAFAVTYVVSDCGYDDLVKCNSLESFFVDGQIKWPTDDGSVQDLCGKLLDGGSCVKSFNDKCGKNEAEKTKFNQRLAGLKLYHSSVCGSPDGRKGFLERVQCYSNPNVEKAMREVHKRYVAIVEKVATFEKGQRKQGICCSLLYIKDAAKGPVTSNCKQETVDYLKSLLSLMSNAFKEECGSITEYAACAAALPGGLGDQLTAISGAASAPATHNPIALPTLFKMWQES